MHSPMNQLELARKYNVSPPNVNDWKSGKRPIPLEKIFSAAEEFGVTLDWLLEGREPKFRESKPEKFDPEAPSVV